MKRTTFTGVIFFCISLPIEVLDLCTSSITAKQNILKHDLFIFFPPLSCSDVLRMCWTQWLGGAHHASSSWVCRASPCWWETSSPRLLVSSTLTPLRYRCCCQSASTLLTEAHIFMLVFCPFMLMSGSTDRGSDSSWFTGVLP